jgi:hypothetical protein
LIVAPLLIISGTIAGAILPDICDVDELQSGQRREGLFTAVMAFVSKLEISLAVVLVGYIVTWSHIDTTIGHRWEATIDGKEHVVTAFTAGESAVFRFKDGQPATFDRFEVRGEVKEVELFVSNESPTTGFRSLGGDFQFAPVTAKYFKVKLVAGDSHLQEIRLTADDGPNLIAAANGGKMLAATPPAPVQKRLFRLVMIPGIIFSFLTMLMTILFPLTEAKMKDVRRQLDERHHVHPETAPDIE